MRQPQQVTEIEIRELASAERRMVRAVFDAAFAPLRKVYRPRGDAPQNLAALRNAGLNCLRQLGIDNVTATLRNFAQKPLRLFRILDDPNETFALP